MAASDGLERLIEDRRLNSIIAWVIVVFVAAVVLESVLTDDIAWAVFASAVLVLALIPPVGYRDRDAMLPWEVLAVCGLPLIGRAISATVLTTQLATYLSVAGVALVVAVELDVFTTVRMTEWFAVLFVVITTMAAAGVWAVLRWSADIWLNTTLLLEPGVPEHEIEEAVMWEFVYSTAAGLLAGAVFELYFRRRARGDARLPDDVRDQLQ